VTEDAPAIVTEERGVVQERNESLQSDVLGVRLSMVLTEACATQDCRRLRRALLVLLVGLGAVSSTFIAGVSSDARERIFEGPERMRGARCLEIAFAVLAGGDSDRHRARTVRGMANAVR
jgi:hypothetical protein